MTNKLSESQKIFLRNVIATHSDIIFSHKAHTRAYWDEGYHEFIGAAISRTPKSKEITFNDLFVPKS